MFSTMYPNGLFTKRAILRMAANLMSLPYRDVFDGKSDQPTSSTDKIQLLTADWRNVHLYKFPVMSVKP